MVVLVNLFKPVPVMKAHVQFGLIGLAGVIALQNVTVVANLELVHVSMEMMAIVLDRPLMINSVIDNLVHVK